MVRLGIKKNKSSYMFSVAQRIVVGQSISKPM